MSIEGGYSKLVLIPIVLHGAIVYSIYTNNLTIKIIATIFVLYLGLIKCMDYRWLG